MTFEFWLDAMKQEGCKLDLYPGGGAIFNDDMTHRYFLWRTIHPTWRSTVAWICCNPSIANGRVNDLTVTKIVRFSQDIGFGRVCLVNLSSGIGTDWRRSPAMSETDCRINRLCWQRAVLADRTVLAWGNLPDIDHMEPDYALFNRAGALCLGVTKKGEPRHPSRLGYKTPLVPFQRRTIPIGA